MGEPTTQTDEQFLLVYLRDRDVSCPGCDYNVRSLTQPRCPECGEQLSLSLRLVEPKQAWVFAGLIALAGGVGFNGLLLFYIAVESIRRSPIPASIWYKFALTNGIGMIVLSAAGYLWLRNWKKIRSASLAVRVCLAVACALLSLIDVMIFSYVIR